MAYSSITNSGFILACFSLYTFEGIFTAFSYLFIYLILTFFTYYSFYIFLPNNSSTTNLSFYHYKLFLYSNPCFLFLLSLNLLSMAGIPPLMGFFSKFVLFTALFESQNFILFFLVLIATLFSCYYYIRIIKLLLFQPITQKDYIFFLPIKYSNAFLISIFVHINLFFCVNPNFIFNFFLTESITLFIFH